MQRRALWVERCKSELGRARARAGNGARAWPRGECGPGVLRRPGVYWSGGSVRRRARAAAWGARITPVPAFPHPHARRVAMGAINGAVWGSLVGILAMLVLFNFVRG